MNALGGSCSGPRTAVFVFAKSPQPGLVKTRMCPPLSPAEAANLYAAMLDDVLVLTAEVCAQRSYALFVTVYPADACAELVARAPQGARVVEQRGRDLAARMADAARRAAAAGYERILLRGSDSPALPAAVLVEAVQALEEADGAISPDVDGGYNVLAVRRPHPGLLDHAMSTASVAEDTLANARRLGLRPRALATSFDLDCVEDLGRLARERLERPAECAASCRRTLELLDRERWWPDPGVDPRPVPGR